MRVAHELSHRTSCTCGRGPAEVRRGTWSEVPSDVCALAKGAEAAHLADSGPDSPEDALDDVRAEAARLADRSLDDEGAKAIHLGDSCFGVSRDSVDLPGWSPVGSCAAHWASLSPC